MIDRVRNPGSGYTVFRYAGNVLAYAQEVRVTSPVPVADAVRIQPLNARRPLEIVTAGAHTGGTITLVLIELANEAIWQRLSSSLNGAQDIVDIMRLQAEIDPDPGVTIDRYIVPPQPSIPPRHETYYGCVITRVQDDETINIGAMQIQKEVDVAFTYSKKFWINNGNRARDLSTAAGINR